MRYKRLADAEVESPERSQARRMLRVVAGGAAERIDDPLYRKLLEQVAPRGEPRRHEDDEVFLRAFVVPSCRQNTNFNPSCTSRIGVLVLLIVPYNGLLNVVFGSFQIGLFNALNASNRNCAYFEPNRKFRMIEKSTLKTPGPMIVSRPALPNVPAACVTYASVLNHRLIVC